MEEQVSIPDNFYKGVRFLLRFPDERIYRGNTYNFKLIMFANDYTPSSWHVELILNPDITEFVDIEELSKEYPLGLSLYNPPDFIGLLSTPLLTPSIKTDTIELLNITLRIKQNCTIGIHSIFNKGVVKYLTKSGFIDYIDNIVDEYNNEKRVVLGKNKHRIIIENKLIRIF